MKINAPRSTQPVSPSRRTPGAGPAQGFAPETAPAPSGPGAAAGVSAASAVNSIEALMALQGADDYGGARKRATDRAFSLLDVLGDLKLEILDGTLPRDTLVRLMETVKTQRDQTRDPRLEAVLDEVEIRAAVELAKHGWRG
ncbi:MAG: flagellar biosynthesis protein FlgI [Alphaproteobacteria bacterium]|nr:flagellar biosynthesis protein FlgI [Alphaproteobacteria bacterium]